MLHLSYSVERDRSGKPVAKGGFTSHAMALDPPVLSVGEGMFERPSSGSRSRARATVFRGESVE